MKQTYAKINGDNNNKQKITDKSCTINHYLKTFQAACLHNDRSVFANNVRFLRLSSKSYEIRIKFTFDTGIYITEVNVHFVQTRYDLT